MQNAKNKRFRELKRSHAWVTILIFIIVFIITAAIIVSFMNVFLQYIMETKISSEYSDVSYMAKSYELSVSEDNSEIIAFLVESGRNYVIKDKDGNIKYQYGENTLGTTEGYLDIAGAEDSIRVVLDKDSDVLQINRGTFNINLLKLLSNLHEYTSDEIKRIEMDHDVDIDVRTSFHEGINVGLELPEQSIDMLYIPFWIAKDVTGGTMYVRSNITVNINDAALFTLLIGLSAVMIIVIFSMMLGNIISSIVRRNRTLNVFFTDLVTGGHNWMWFVIKGQQFLTRRKNYSTRYAVVSLVFVHYMNFCVCHSVEEGEHKLRKVYSVIRNSLGKKEMCAHSNQAEFAIIIKSPDNESLKQRVQSLIDELALIDSDHTFAFQAGIVIVEPDGTPDKNGTPIRRKTLDIESVYNNACTARAELEGSDDSGIAFFDDKLIEDQKWIDTVHEHQQSALANEEFVVYYQPKYDPRTDELRGAEALIRWQSPEFGFVPPGKIIPIYEKNGFITEIDHYMLRHVARDQKAWLDMGCKCVPVSVNVSRAHFIENDLAEQIRDLVDEAGAPHDLIEIELTESAFFDDKKAMISTISRLKEYGFAVSMDDFGSGYSSLNSLKDMPLDVLKLDAEFFRGNNDNGRGEIVVSEAIKLAKNLNMRTVAEGVEVRDQVDFLASQGCDMIQGYYYAKPMPKEEYAARMKPARSAAVPETSVQPAAVPEAPVEPAAVPEMPEEPSAVSKMPDESEAAETTPAES